MPALPMAMNRLLTRGVSQAYRGSFLFGCCFALSHDPTRNMGSSTTTNADYPTPSSLNGPPTCALVAPGQCQFGDQLTSVPLLQRVQVSPTSSVMRFGLPDKTKPLNLSTCACILASENIKNEDVTRPYTPITTNAQKGSFDLLIKDYGPDAHMSHHICHDLKVGEKLAFKHMDGNVKLQAPFGKDHLLMCVGGAGITPMIQALHAILGDKNSQIKVTMLYGSKVKEDILGKELLEKWAHDHPDRFTLVHVLSDEPSDSSWTGERGMIDKARLHKYEPYGGPEGRSNMIFVCGPPPMYTALCGKREEKDKISGALGEMGYKPEQVYKF